MFRAQVFPAVNGRTAASWRTGVALSLLLVPVAGLLSPTAAWGGEDEQRWASIRAALFGEREIHDGSGLVDLEAPVRAHDAAVVPIAATTTPGAGDRRIARLHLIVDNNPAPVASVFHFPEGGAAGAVETRIRVNEYTNVRAIAETRDGQLFMASRYVKASGGCSAPAQKDAEAAMARIGKMKLRIGKDVVLGEPTTVQLLVSHPNYSGMQKDQITHYYIPAHFVQKVNVTYNGQPVFSQEGDISLSENPSIRFTFVPREAGELVAVVEDSKGMSFEGRWTLDDGTR